MLKDYQIFQTIDLVKDTIERIRTFEPDDGYYLAFSGGKDSIVIKHLAERAGVEFDAHYNVTTIDPPELVWFIKKYHSDVIFEHPDKPFLVSLVNNGFPQRQRRWCCREYKEGGGSGRMVMTGIRRAESYSRSGRKMVETCYKDTTKRYMNPIIDWKDEDIWEYINKNNIPYCKLYDEGYKRLGCLFCPMESNKMRIKETSKYPKYTKLFIKYFEKLYKDRKERGLKSVDRWKDGEEMFWWWIKEPKSKNDKQEQIF